MIFRKLLKFPILKRLIPSVLIRLLKILKKNRGYFKIKNTKMFLDFLDPIDRELILHNEYESLDLDFVSFDDRKKIEKVMLTLGFRKEQSRHFTHPNTDIFVEFPGAALLIGDQPIKEFSKVKNKYGTLKLLTPTDSVLDRLAAFYHWDDRQGLDQAIMICKKQKVNLSKVKSWSMAENMSEKYDLFLQELKR